MLSSGSQVRASQQLLDLAAVTALCERYRTSGETFKLNAEVDDFANGTRARFELWQRAVALSAQSLFADLDELYQRCLRLGAVGLAALAQSFRHELENDPTCLPVRLPGLRGTFERTVNLLKLLIDDNLNGRVRRILFVDDEPELVALLGEFFEGRGWRISRAGNGNEALEILKRESVDVIVTDWNMPGMKGDAFAQVVRLRHREPTPIFLITAFPDESIEKMMGPAGFYAVLCKPFTFDSLWNAVVESLAN